MEDAGQGDLAVPRRTLPKTLGVLALVGGLIAAGSLYQVDFKLDGEGRFRPVEQQPVFTQIEGQVDELLVDYNSPVQQGQTVMMLRSLDLDAQYEELRGQLNQARAEQETLLSPSFDSRREDPDERRQKDAKLVQVERQIDSLKRQIAILNEKKKLLTITSPITGRVIQWKLREQFPVGRPVPQGAPVMEIADPSGDWEVELLMPEKRMGRIQQAWEESQASGEPLRVDFIPATKPEETIQGTVVEIDQTAESRGEEGNAVKMRVTFDQSEFRRAVPDPKIDAVVTANVYCGKSSFFYYWLHDLYDTIRSEILFRF